MKKSIMILAGVFFAGVLNAQDEQTLVKDDLQTLGKEQKELRAQEKTERKEWKAQAAVLVSKKKTDKAELQTLSAADVSYFTKAQFYEDFGSVPISGYEHIGLFEVVCFTGESGASKAFYDTGYKLVGTLTEKQFSDLPQKAQAYLNKAYAAYDKGQVFLFDDNEANDTPMELFGASTGEDNYFIKLTKDGQSRVLRITLDGNVLPFAGL